MGGGVTNSINLHLSFKFDAAVMGLLSLDISKFPSASLSLSEIAIRKDYAGIISIKMKWNSLKKCFLQVFHITIWAPDLRLGEVNIMWILVLITAIELFLSLSLWSLAIDQERESLLFWNTLSNEVVLSWLIISLLLHWFQEFLLYNKWKMSFVNKIKKENKEK